MHRCPNCRARLDADPRCPRCGMELGLLRSLEKGFDAAVAQAILRLAEGEAAEAAGHLRYALRLRRDPLASEILALIERNP